MLEFFRKSPGHLGLVLVLCGGIFGALTRTEVRVRLHSGGGTEMVPFRMSLNDLRVDIYDGTSFTKQVTSVLEVEGRKMETSVNHPCRYAGYRIYQAGYDTEREEYSELMVVRDPCMPIAAVGALLLALGAVRCIVNVWNGRKVLVAAVPIAVLFAAVSLVRISIGTLPPALRSLWFVPHLAAYMLAYATLTLSLITAFFKKGRCRLSGRLLATSSSLLLLGMLCGAFWAQQAWGEYWSWDPKECLAGITWIIACAGTHLRHTKAAPVFAALAFLSMQMTWYGVNYLPSSQSSLHTYNRTESPAITESPGHQP